MVCGLGCRACRTTADVPTELGVELEVAELRPWAHQRNVCGGRAQILGDEDEAMDETLGAQGGAARTARASQAARGCESKYWEELPFI